MEDNIINLFVICTFGLVICDAGEPIKQLIYHKGARETNISCNESDVINITDILTFNYPTHCSKNKCDLTDADRKYIEMCNGNSTCEIQIDKLSSCLKDRGYFSVNYTCQEIVTYCDFEDVTDQCFFEENDWTITKPDHILLTPSVDHTTGSAEGRFMYVWTGKNEQTFHSKQILGSTKQCLTFFYYKRFPDDLILIKIQHMNGSLIEQYEVQKPDKSYLWNKETLSINGVVDYTLAIIATGHSGWSRFAVDDISIRNRDCQTDCDFESNWCSWKGSSRWFRQQGETPTGDTGPLTDHTTTTASGHYVYMEANEMYNGQKERITSPTYFGSGEMCFTFWYCMYGAKMGSLRLYIESSRKISEVFYISGNHGQRWHPASIGFNVNGEFNVIIEGQCGTGIKSDIAIDDISLLFGNCKGSVQHHQTCNKVDEKVELNECSNHFLSNIQVNFDPWKDLCKDFLESTAHSICNNSSYTVLCDVRNITRKRPSCFNLNNLVIEYTCAELQNKPLANEESRLKDSTGVIVGAVIGLLLVVGVIVLFIVHRRRQYQRTGQNKNSTIDYSASLHSNGQPNHQTHLTKDIQTSNNGLATNRGANNPSYGQGYIIAASKHTTNKQDTEYMNITAREGNLIPQNVDGEYNVLNPAKTGFNRSNPAEYKLASTVNEVPDDN